ncbi:hypothetical protein EE612_012402, partial [Oryza sativa]
SKLSYLALANNELTGSIPHQLRRRKILSSRCFS